MSSAPILGQTVLSNAKGLATGSWVRVLNFTVTPVISERSYSFYDAKGRAIRSYTLNHLGGFTQNDLQLDFAGQVLASTTSHKRSTSDAVVVTNEYFEYTDQGKLRNHYHQINGGQMERLTTNVYDNLGQLLTKDVGGSPSVDDGLQKVNYQYNIRGWLTHINSLNHLDNGPGQFADLFAFKINYNTVENNLGNTISPLFNGNISETFWQTESDGTVRKYGYKYDQLNRLQKAVYQKPYEAIPLANSYNELLWYDKNGNIQQLQRSGEVDDATYELVMDNLTYTYDNIKKNQLNIVYDAANNPNGFTDDSQGTPDTTVDYSYDLYGNMTADTNKGITQIRYNHLNLPIKVTLTGGIIEYLYNATGVKVQKKVTQSSVVTTTDYQSGYQHKNGQLQFFPHAEGYVNVVEGNYFNYVYNYTDHLGNIRVSYGLEPGTNVLKILEENHYYPFGLKHKNYNVDIRTYDLNNLGQIILPSVSDMSYKYKYNGKEWQDELGLNVYDFAARNYDPAIGRTHILDPHAENYYHLSPSSFLNNNPILFIDPDGKDFIISYVDKDGKNQEHRFNGGSDVLPDNKFVQDFVAAYRYNIENGGGASMEAIATNSDATVYVEYGEFSQQDNGKPGVNVTNVITWNNEMGLETTNGYVLSPATGLEHEAAHALNAINNPGVKHALSTTPDKQYDNKEEKRVIQGPEQATAKANGEIPPLGVTRNDHNGRPVITESATSNKVNVPKTQQWTKSFNSRGIFAKGKYKK